MAVIELDRGAHVSADVITERCAAELAKYKVPERIIRLDAFPVTTSANGVKVQKAKLRDMAAELA